MDSLLTPSPGLWRTDLFSSAPSLRRVKSGRNLISLSLWPGLALILAVLPIECRAQGTLEFSNNGFPIITSNLQGATGRIAQLQCCFGLYMGTSDAAVQNSTSPVLVVTNHVFPGIFSAGDVVLPGFDADTWYYLQVKGWYVDGCPVSYETALMNDPTGYFGVSQIGMVLLTQYEFGGGILFGTSYPQVPVVKMMRVEVWRDPETKTNGTTTNVMAQCTMVYVPRYEIQVRWQLDNFVREIPSGKTWQC